MQVLSSAALCAACHRRWELLCTAHSGELFGALNHGTAGDLATFYEHPFHRSSALNDEALVPAVEAALRHTGYCSQGEITVAVAQGWVTLTGQIEWDFQKRTALYAVRAVPGVSGIVDNIVLRFIPLCLSSPEIRGLAQAAPA